MSRLISYCLLRLVKFYLDGCSLNVLVRIEGIFFAKWPLIYWLIKSCHCNCGLWARSFVSVCTLRCDGLN